MTTPTDEGGVYRAGDGAARYVCTVCFRTASPALGVCSTCGVERPPLDNPQVVDELRARVGSMIQKRETRGWTLVVGAGSLVAVAIYLALGWVGWVGFRSHRFVRWGMPMLEPEVLVPLWFAVNVPLGLWYQRRRTKVPDADSMNVAELLAQLGVQSADGQPARR